MSDHDDSSSEQEISDQEYEPIDNAEEI